MPRRVLVTGGAGFIGSHLVEALVARGDDVVVVDDLSIGRRENVAVAAGLIEADVREPLEPIFEQIDPHVCFHFAAQTNVRWSVASPAFDAATNVLGTLNVLEAARTSESRVIFASSGGAVYGETDVPATEDAVCRPLSPYGVSKLAADEYLATYNRLHGFRHVSLRFGNVYGPRQDPRGEAGVVAIFLANLAKGEAPVIYGTGEQTRDYVYVADVVLAALAAASTPVAGIFNIGTGKERSVNTVLALCRRVTDTRLVEDWKPARRGEIQRSALDAGRAARELGWQPALSLETGIRLTYAE